MNGGSYLKQKVKLMKYSTINDFVFAKVITLRISDRRGNS